MDFQEHFFKDQIQQIHDATIAKEDRFEKLQQEERKKIEESRTVASSTEDYRRRYKILGNSRLLIMFYKLPLQYYYVL